MVVLVLWCGISSDPHKSMPMW